MFRIARGQPTLQGVENANIRDVEYMNSTIFVKREAPDQKVGQTNENCYEFQENDNLWEVFGRVKHVIFKN